MQELISTLLVVLAVGYLGLIAIRKTVGESLALWLIKRGVSAKLAMRLRPQGGGCDDCSCK